MAEKKEKVQKTSEQVLKELEKDYGKGSIIHGKQEENDIEVVSTGSLQLDIALGIGGIPIGNPGKIVEIYGWESSGKSTISQNIIGNYQKLKKKKCLYIDGENSLEGDYATTLGVDFDDLYVIQLDSHAGEGAYNKMERLVETGEFGIVIVDSASSLQPKKVIDGEIGDSNMGVHARMLGQVVMKANSLCVEYGCTFVFINQLREKIGVMYGSPETTQGGNALKFYAHIRMNVGRSTTNDNSEWEGKKGESERLGNQHNVKIIKNKLAAPFKKAEFYIRYGEGIDKIRELIDTGHDLTVLKVYGESIFYNGTKYNGEEFKQMLRDNDDLFEEIRNKILVKAGILQDSSPQEEKIVPEPVIEQTENNTDGNKEDITGNLQE